MKTLKTFCFAGLLATVMLSCKKDAGSIPEKPKNKEIPSIPLQAPDPFSQDEYDIYSVIIEERTSGKIAVVAQETGSILDYDAESVRVYFKRSDKIDPSIIDSNTIDSFFRVNDKKYFLENKFVPKGIATYLLAEKEAALLVNTYDEVHYKNYLDKKFPECNGYLQFRRPGINSTKTEAIIDVGHYSGFLNAGGYLYYLKKINGKWEIIDKVFTWIS